MPFILQDGTGGIKVNLESFKRTDYGQFIKQWDGAFAQTLGKQLMASAVAGLLGGARVKKHRWTIYGLRLGDPVYLLGATKPRPASELQAEGQGWNVGQQHHRSLGQRRRHRYEVHVDARLRTVKRWKIPFRL